MDESNTLLNRYGAMNDPYSEACHELSKQIYDLIKQKQEELNITDPEQRQVFYSYVLEWVTCRKAEEVLRRSMALRKQEREDKVKQRLLEQHPLQQETANA